MSARSHLGGVVGALVDLDRRPYYLHWGVVQLSAANAIVVVAMVVVFVLALVLPFPKDRGR